MASNYTNLGVQLMTTGEKAGTWGTLTNTNWNIIEQISGGYATQALTSGGTVTLVKSDGSTGAVMATRIWKLTGALSDNAIVTVPDSIENWWIINNASTNAYTVQVKTVSGTGITWATTDKGTKLLYTDGTNVIDASSGFGEVTLTNTVTLTNKTLTSPKIGTSILDTGGNELALLTATGSALNEFTIANAATGAGPTLSATGTETNVPINITPKGTGDVFINPPTSGSLAIKGNATNGGKLKLFEDTDLGAYHTGFTTGNLSEDIVYTLPLADAVTSGDALTSNASGVLSWTTMSGGTSWQAVDTTGFTAVAGEGYFCNTTSAAFTATLPAGSIGDECTFVDYAGTFDTNNLTVGRNGSDKINGSAADLTVAVERAAFTLVFTDSTQGWLLKDK